MKPSEIVEEQGAGFSAEDKAKADALRNHSESTTQAGGWRFVERLLNARVVEVEDRERRLREGEAAIAAGVKEAEIKARTAAAIILEEASKRASDIIKAAMDDAGQLGQKAAVDAGAIRQAAQEHLVAGIALADVARLPPKVQPSGADMLMKLGEKFLSTAGSVFERLMVANPEATARLAGSIADAVGNDAAPAADGASAANPSRGHTFNEVAVAAEALGEKRLAEFLATVGAKVFADLTMSDGAALIVFAHKVQQETSHVPG